MATTYHQPARREATQRGPAYTVRFSVSHFTPPVITAYPKVVSRTGGSDNVVSKTGGNDTVVSKTGGDN